MKKIPSLFLRDETDRSRLTRVVTPGCEWVPAGEGRATRKWDGTAVLVRDGQCFKRFDAKQGKTPPPGFEPAQEPDPITGHWPGWVMIGDRPEDRWHREGFAYAEYTNGTYELCGPKISGNPEGFTEHLLVLHGGAPLDAAPTDFDRLREYLSIAAMEGIVWHHPDGRMAKIKRRDFGLVWPIGSTRDRCGG